MIVLLLTSCGYPDPYYYDPYYDPWVGMDPWDPCAFDPYGCYGYGDGSYDPYGIPYDPTGYGNEPMPADPGFYGSDFGPAFGVAKAPCDTTLRSCQLRSTSDLVDRSMRAAARLARQLRASSQQRSDGVEVAGPLVLDRSQAAMRLTVRTSPGGETRWELEAQLSGASEAYRPVFSGSSVTVRDHRTGSIDIDLDALAAATSWSGVQGHVTGTFSREGRNATADLLVAPSAASGPPAGAAIHLSVDASPGSRRTVLSADGAGEVTVEARP